MKKSLLAIVVLFLGIDVSMALYPNVRNFTKQTYKAGTQNWDVAQSKDGYLYFANNSGVLEFDGENWRTHTVANYTTVRSLKYDSTTNRLYAGAFQEFGYFTPTLRGLTYNSMTNLFQDLENVTEIWHIDIVEGSIYFRSDWCILKYDGTTTTKFNFKNKIDFSAEVHNTLFVATQKDGVRILSGDMFLTLPNSDILKNKKVCSILPYKEQEVLFVTDLDGIYIYDGISTKRFESPLDKYLIKYRIFAAASNDKYLALGSVSDGLFVLNYKDNSILDLNRPKGLQNNTILNLSFDYEDNLWLGLDSGIDYVVLNLPELLFWGGANHYGAGYASLLENNTLYLGTNQGLFYTKFPIQSDNMDFTPIPNTQGQVWDLVKIDNTLFCSHDKGLFVIDNERVHRIPDIDGTLRVSKMRNHKNKELLLGCSYEGLFILEKKNNKWGLSHKIKGFKESSAAYEQDDAGNIWINHWINGLSKLTLNENLDSVTIKHYGVEQGLPSDGFNSPYIINDELVFSSEGGIFRYSQSLDSMIYYDRYNKLFKTPPSGFRMFQSQYKDIFFLSEHMFSVALIDDNREYKIDSLSLHFLKNNLILGFESLSFPDRESVILSNENGFSMIDLSAIVNESKQPHSYPVIIKNIYITNRQDSLVYDQRAAHTIQENNITFSHRNNSLRFEFIVPEYRAENVIEYRTKLDHFDEFWSAYSNVKRKEYTGLKKGTYNFRVQARNRFSNEISESSFAFTIRPAWYESNLAFFIYLVILSTVLWVTGYLFHKRYDKKVLAVESAKEQELAEQKTLYEEEARKQEEELVKLKIQTLEYDLKMKSQDLASSTLNLIRKNEILQKLDEDLSKVIPEIKTESGSNKATRQIKSIQKEIKENIESDFDWKKFQHNFDMVYDNYLSKLCDDFPDLTMNDQRLCAYLRMNLQSKDIAPLMNITVRSVEMARYRLRKKLNLEQGDNLYEFLQKR